jgi:hypothetical protein
LAYCLIGYPCRLFPLVAGRFWLASVVTPSSSLFQVAVNRVMGQPLTQRVAHACNSALRPWPAGVSLTPAEARHRKSGRRMSPRRWARRYQSHFLYLELNLPGFYFLAADFHKNTCFVWLKRLKPHVGQATSAHTFVTICCKESAFI